MIPAQRDGHDVRVVAERNGIAERKIPGVLVRVGGILSRRWNKQTRTGEANNSEENCTNG